MSSPILTVNKVSFHYSPEQVILQDIDLQLHQGEVLGIIGPNGGGKSTLLKILVGLLHQTSGEYQIQGKVHSLRTFPYQLFGYVPQKKELNSIFPLTTLELLQLEKNNSTVTNQIIDTAIQNYNLTSFLNSQINQLSGGQLQRLLIARTLLKNPKILILDEPSTGLDTQGIDQLGSMIKTIRAEKKQAIILVDHNIKQILKYSDMVLCLNKQHHWHDKKEKLSKHVLESVYHCEYEHELIHEQLDSSTSSHHHCCDHSPQEVEKLEDES